MAQTPRDRPPAPRRTLALTLTCLLLTGVAGAPAADSEDLPGTGSGQRVNGQRGELLAVQPLRSLPDARSVRTDLARAGYGTGAVRAGVDTYQLLYRTAAPGGGHTVASGLLALPRTRERTLSTVSTAHGTEMHRTAAPSLGQEPGATAPAVAFAAAGFAAVAPDHLGLGLGPGPHPYLDLPTEASASLDLLRAARTAVRRHGRELGRHVYVTGFSQGATAATALARTLQAETDGWFRLSALAPVAGAYDPRGSEIPAILAGRLPPVQGSGYLAYLLVAWNRLHGLYADPREVFTSPAADVVESLFDGLHTGRDLAAVLPADARDLLTPRGRELLADPDGPLADALSRHDSSCRDLRPGTSVRLLVSPADEQVPAGNTEHCRRALAGSGTDAPVVTLPVVEHDGSAHLGAGVAGVAAALAWFTELDRRVRAAGRTAGPGGLPRP